MILLLIAILLSLLYLAYLLFYISGWLGMNTSIEAEQESSAVSLIICLRNEELNIIDCLNSVAPQINAIPGSEIILVDDFSEDQSLALLEKWNGASRKIISLQNVLAAEFRHTANKKRGIECALDEAKNELILMTDADCRLSPDWVQAMRTALQKKDSLFVTGPIVFHESAGFFQRFQQLDLLSLMGITAGCLHHHFPVMANGANMAFRKSAFRAVGGYSKDTFSSGDDVFLMQKLEKEFPASCHFVKDPRAVVFTKAESGLGDWIQQRKRWLSKGRNFPNAAVSFNLFYMWFFNLFCWLAAAYSLLSICSPLEFSIRSFLGGILPLSLKLLIDFIFLMLLSSWFRAFYSKWWTAKMFLLYLPIQCMHMMYVCMLGVWSTIGGYHWKGRKIER